LQTHEEHQVPLSGFKEALRGFQSGHLAYEDLYSELVRQLTVERSPCLTLLEILRQHESMQPLPGDAHAAISKHIEEWPEDPTIFTGAQHAGSVAGGLTVGVGDILKHRFSLQAVIGVGGMSEVFKAIDLRLAETGAADPYVAVKVLNAAAARYFDSPEVLDRGARKLQSLIHPNIARVLGCERDGDTVFLTMEYVPGRSLQRVLRAAGAGATQPAAMALLAAVGEALEYAHGLKIVHGDLKPGNIIVTDDGMVKVVDFGMAEVVEVVRCQPSADGAAPPGGAPKALTPRYASPELAARLAAGHDAEPVDDVYALACIAYELLSGTHPFGPDAAGAGAVRDSSAGNLTHRSAPLRPSRPSKPPQPPGMPTHQYLALVRALAFERKDRTPNVRRFLDELAAIHPPAAQQRRGWFMAVAIAPLALAVLWTHGHRAPSQQRPLESAAAAVVAVGSVLQDCPTCPRLTVLPPGRFIQGSAPAAARASRFELPRHVVLVRSVAMSATEVTVAQFREFSVATRRVATGCNIYAGRWEYRQDASWEAPGFDQSGEHPVTCVSWDDADAYARWLTAKSGHRYRLPSASEWEYAARAGGESLRPWGDDAAAACAQANVADRSAAERFPGWTVFPCADDYVNTAPVGSFKANAFGLNDLLGNVFEWVQDCWHDDYRGAPVNGSAWAEPGCVEHELRGGSWFSAPQYVSASYRNRFEHDYRSSSVGFRVAREIGS
jgi:formylglycine-generating enzyme required for sulfatase activity